MKQRSFVTVAALSTAAVLATSGCGSSSKSSAKSTGSTASTASAATGASSGKLVGTFKISSGSCTTAAVSGSYFRMVQSGGTTTAGPYVSNTDSSCTNKTYSALTAGTDGGLITGSYQPEPTPPFDASHNGTADKITKPTKFYAVDFAVSTNAKDPQTGASVPVPEISVDAAGKLTGDLSAVGVAWNGQQFNQGAPKPKGASSAGTTGPNGTFTAATGAYVLEWTSKISGGPFNGFTGVWHLEGSFGKAS